MIFNKIIEIWRAPSVQDPYGEYRDWNNATRVASGPASVQPFNTNEQLVDRDTTVTKYKIYYPAPFTIESTDRVLIDGEWWEVYGEAFDWTFRPLNSSKYIKFYVRRVEN